MYSYVHVVYNLYIYISHVYKYCTHMTAAARKSIVPAAAARSIYYARACVCVHARARIGI